jgi:hypothetical protein
MKHDADESSFGTWARNIPSSDATHRGGNQDRTLQASASAPFATLETDGECLDGRCPRREPRTTGRAKQLFDRRLVYVDERATPSAM